MTTPTIEERCHRESHQDKRTYIEDCYRIIQETLTEFNVESRYDDTRNSLLIDEGRCEVRLIDTAVDFDSEIVDFSNTSTASICLQYTSAEFCARYGVTMVSILFKIDKADSYKMVASKLSLGTVRTNDFSPNSNLNISTLNEFLRLNGYTDIERFNVGYYLIESSMRKVVFGATFTLTDDGRKAHLVNFRSALGAQVQGGLSRIIKRLEEDHPQLQEITATASVRFGSGMIFPIIGFEVDESALNCGKISETQYIKRIS